MKFKYSITGLDCPNCALKLSGIIEAKDGIESVKINYLTEKITVESSLSDDDTFALVTDCAKHFEDGIVIGK